MKEFAFDDSNVRLSVNCANETVSKVHQNSIGEMLIFFNLLTELFNYLQIDEISIKINQ